MRFPFYAKLNSDGTVEENVIVGLAQSSGTIIVVRRLSATEPMPGANEETELIGPFCSAKDQSEKRESGSSAWRPIVAALGG